MEVLENYTVLILTGLFYILAFYNCYHIVGARMSPGSAISWIWANLTLPFIGVPLYWLIGGGRLKEYPIISYPVEPRGELSEEDAPFLTGYNRIFGNLGHEFVASSNKISLFTEGAQTFDEIFLSIAAAKRYVFVQYYILRSDRLGHELKRALINKACQGVEIFLLYDDMGSFWLSERYITELTNAGVKVASFMPIASARRLFQANYRNHRKLVLVDGEVAFTGGLNVGEEYAGTKYETKLHWRDAHLKLSGSALFHLENLFMADWEFATNHKVELERNLTRMVQDFPGGITCPLQVIPSGPGDLFNVGALLFSQLIQSSKKRLWVSSPFFIPDEALQRDLHLAVLRGVDVRILVPRESPKRFVHWVTLSYAEQMQNKGVKIYLYEKGFLHQKAILVDDALSCTGTSNFDNRALYLNFELMLLIHSKEFNQSLAEYFLRDIRDSSEFFPEKDRWIRKLVRFRANSARLLAPLL